MLERAAEPARALVAVGAQQVLDLAGAAAYWDALGAFIDRVVG
jgi:hypothetical protein